MFSLFSYTKPLVASASLSDQKYNPEISGSPPQDARVAALADRLQQARQVNNVLKLLNILIFKQDTDIFVLPSQHKYFPIFLNTKTLR